MGEFSNSGEPDSGPALIEHWNGSRWSVVPSPNTQLPLNVLSGVAAVSPNDIWAVGYAGSGDPESTLTEVWNP